MKYRILLFIAVLALSAVVAYLRWYLPNHQNYIRGRVIDAGTGKPIAGARVVIALN